MRLLIDCDAGLDDAVALLLACRSEHEIVGVTCCEGNTHVANVARNVRHLLDITGRHEVPVFSGTAKPLAGNPLIRFPDFHGEAGLGSYDPGEPRVPHKDEPAAAAIVRLCKEAPTRVIATGPLTNIALAARLDASFFSRLESLHIMGGSTKGGNITPSAEFNFHCDPEAANIVMREATCPVIVTPLEPCVEDICKFSWEWFDSIWVGGDNAVKKLMLEAHSAIDRKIFTWYETYDPFTAAIALDESLLLEFDEVECEVECQGNLTRGHWILQPKLGANIRVVKRIHGAAVAEMIEALAT